MPFAQLNAQDKQMRNVVLIVGFGAEVYLSPELVSIKVYYCYCMHIDPLGEIHTGLSTKKLIIKI